MTGGQAGREDGNGRAASAGGCLPSAPSEAERGRMWAEARGREAGLCPGSGGREARNVEKNE